MSLPENYVESIRTASEQRNTLCNYFISPTGEIQWQYDYVRRGTHGENI